MKLLSEYRHRRLKLLKRMEPNSALLLSSVDADEDSRRSNSDLYYLSGFEENHAAILLLNGRKQKQVLFCLPLDDTRNLWHGSSLGPAAARKKLSFDEAYPLKDIKEYLICVLRDIETLYFQMGEKESKWIIHLVNKLRKVNRRSGRQTPTRLIHSDQLLGSMRLIKSAQEIALITRAASISVAAHNQVMKKLPQLHYEYQVEAELLYYYRSHNAYSAFPPIVAAGANSCILHYMHNNCPIRLQDCLLVDSGAEYKRYAADLTRTYAPRRRRDTFNIVHQAVTKALEQAYQAAKLEASFSDLHKVTVRTLTKELIRMNIIKETLRQAIASGSYKQYFPHLTSHWIGLDVHDSGDYDNSRLKAGMVFSIEPGLYFRSDDQTVAPKWRGIGVRIEDTIVMTSKGAQNITKDASYFAETPLE